MRRRHLALALSLLAAPAVGAGLPCADLTSLALPDTTVTAAAIAGDRSCRVQGVVAPSDHFDVWLPADWNGKFMGVGGGGFVGYINVFGMTPALARGYATASTDTGHTGSPLDASWALGHPELVVDFGYRGVHVVTDAAKRIVEAFYGTPPARAYFLGCSTGGRQGLMEAQRYPLDYDGIIAGDPAADFTHLTTASNWVSQAVHEDPASVIPASKLPAIAAAVLARCDAKDGIADGLLNDPRTCRFNPARLRCKGPETDTCLTSPQIAGLKKLYAGARTSKGKRIFPGYVPGGEVGVSGDAGPAGEPATGGWEAWIVGSTPGLQHQIQDSFFKYVVFADPSWDWRTLDYDRDVQIADAAWASTLNAMSPNLLTFRAHGGKLVLYHGWSDPAVTPLRTIAYYESIVAAMGGGRAGTHATEDFVRLFMAPGMQHCAGGPGPNTFDAIGALEQWVEQGVAPDAIVATHRTGGVVDRTRPLCSYPRTARYTGSGSADDAANFTCAPKRGRARR